MGDEESVNAAVGGDTRAAGYAPHPYVGGRTPVLRALAAWRMRWPGAPRVIVLTGDPGSGRSRLITGFLMLCDPAHRRKLPLDDLDPATVPPDLPAPAVPNPTGRTAAQVLWLLADQVGLRAGRSADVLTEFAAHEEPVTVVVPDVDRAGPVRAANEPARLIRDVLKPLAALETVHLLADVPRALAGELAEALPAGQVQIIDLDAPEWADPKGLVRYAESALDAATGAPDLPYTTDPTARRELAGSMAARAEGSRLTVQLAVQSLLMQPDGFDPGDPAQLPANVGEALDLHARRTGADPQTLRLMLAPLAFAEGEGLPVQLLEPLATALAGRDMSRDLADGMLLAAPFVEPVEAGGGSPEGGAGGGNGSVSGSPAGSTHATDSTAGSAADSTSVSAAGGGRTLLRLLHPGISEEIRSGLPDVRDAQTKIAMTLLEAVPHQDWSQADPYIRDHLAAHTLEAGLLPQLLTDPGLFAHADPVTLRAAVEAVPLEQLGAPARTYLRTAPLFTRTDAPADVRAALLESAFVEDGLVPYAEALHKLGFDLPWRTLWSVPLTGVRAVTTGAAPVAGAPGATDGGTPAHRAVAVFVVPEGTPGSWALPGRPDDGAPGDGDVPENGGGVAAGGPEAGAPAAGGAPGQGEAPSHGSGGLAFLVHDLRTPDYIDIDPSQVVQCSQEARATAPLGLSRGADHLRVWTRAGREVVAALVSDSPITGADLSPDGVLVVATGRGVTAREILAPVPATTPTVPAQRTATADASHGLEGDHS
ncbi:ATP-binding protein [Streptomyces sp. NPDC056411]|uniref:ATP-binding protein n=1 Tax=Streptomyces sp. NPDC056411 TaxID=3345813 RepID=UPI0035D70CA5